MLKLSVDVSLFFFATGRLDACVDCQNRASDLICRSCACLVSDEFRSTLDLIRCGSSGGVLWRSMEKARFWGGQQQHQLRLTK